MGKIFSVEFLIQSIPQIAVYLPITLLITIASCVAGLIVGFFIALARYFEVRVLKTVAKVYISFIRWYADYGTVGACVLRNPDTASCDERSIGNKF